MPYLSNITPENITELKADEIFVFGSNLAGKHGAGAAKLAHEKFGAEWGCPVGLKGQTYALPTKDGNIQTLSLAKIQEHIDQFLHFTKLEQSESLKFLVTAIGTGLAGYNAEQIAPLFNNRYLPDNVYLPKSFINVYDQLEARQNLICLLYHEINITAKKMYDGTLHQVHCNSNHNGPVGQPGCSCKLGHIIQELKFKNQNLSEHIEKLVLENKHDLKLDV